MGLLGLISWKKIQSLGRAIFFTFRRHISEPVALLEPWEIWRMREPRSHLRVARDPGAIQNSGMSGSQTLGCQRGDRAPTAPHVTSIDPSQHLRLAAISWPVSYYSCGCLASGRCSFGCYPRC
jgi:hypothetical protein